MKDVYKELTIWLAENPNFSYWIVLFSVTFVFLLLVYVIVSNIRLHMHITSLVSDKERLMQEKDLMRKGLVQHSSKEDD